MLSKKRIPLVFLAAGVFFLAGFFLVEKKPKTIIFEKEQKNQKIDFFQEKYENENAENADMPELEKNEEDVFESKQTADDLETKKEVKEEIGIKNNLVSWGFSNANGRKIDTIIIHSSYNALGGEEYDVKKLLAEYKEYGVAPHYLIDRKGMIYRLVEDKNVAWHAGESKTPDGRKNVNDFSVGIELMNTKNDKYTSEQYAAMTRLLDYFKGKYKIKYVLGHKDIAPGRKDDPWNFDWGKVR